MEIKKLDDIKYNESPVIQFNATVIEIQNEGDGEKRPYKFVVKLEETGETVSVTSWKFDNLQTIKDLVNSDEVYKFEATAGIFGNYGEQIRVGNISPTGLHSTKKILRTKVINEVQRELSTIAAQYIKTDILRVIVNKLIFENDDFFKWPAATKVHHNYQGGLAVHTLGVVKDAISLWQNYQGENLDIELIVAGAMLHDIGKLKEYNLDGSRTIFGNLIPHPVSGADDVITIAMNHGADPDRDLKVLMLRHIILSHHEKLEFGAATTPFIPEAWIVASADHIDARVETINSTLANMTKFQTSDCLQGLDKNKILKWRQ